MTATETPTALTLDEAAYAYLASFRHGERVAITGPRFYSEATITIPQREFGPTIERAYLIATDRLHPEIRTRVTVRHLLNGRLHIEHDNDGTWNGIHTDWAAQAVSA